MYAIRIRIPVRFFFEMEQAWRKKKFSVRRGKRLRRAIPLDTLQSAILGLSSVFWFVGYFSSSVPA